MNEIIKLVGCTQRRKGTNQGGWPQAGHWIFTRRYAGSPYGSRLGMFSNLENSFSDVSTHQSWFLATSWRVFHIFVVKIKSCQLHNPFIDSQTSWYLLLTTTEIPIIIPGLAHPCWILATKNLKTLLIWWYIISLLWLFSEVGWSNIQNIICSWKAELFLFQTGKLWYFHHFSFSHSSKHPMTDFKVASIQHVNNLLQGKKEDRF